MSSQIDAAEANDGCVGPASERAGTAEACEGCPNAAACASGAGRAAPEDPTPGLVRDRLAGVKHVLLVLSGKGGVGKSTMSCQLALALASRGYDVGLLDIDICGPSVPRMMGLRGRGVHQSSSGWSPVYVDSPGGELGVMSVGFMLPEDDNAIIWRGPRKNGLIKQFLTKVDWGDLDFLVVDTPPGTSDEHISIAQYLKLADVAGALVVTTPQEVAMQDVRKELNFCAKTRIPVLGVVGNMCRLRVPLSSLEFVDRRTGRDGGDPAAPPRGGPDPQGGLRRRRRVRRRLRVRRRGGVARGHGGGLRRALPRRRAPGPRPPARLRRGPVPRRRLPARVVLRALQRGPRRAPHAPRGERRPREERGAVLGGGRA